MEERTKQKERILDGTIAVFNQKGLKFTMDDLAKELGMSKKTIYVSYNDKKQLFLDMVDYLFDSIARDKFTVISDPTLNTLEKIRLILKVMPEGYKDIDFKQLYLLKDKYPDIYKRVEERLETGWEPTIALIEQGIREGVVKPVPIFLVKMILESSLEQFFQRDVLVKNKMSYSDGLETVVNILIDGISEKNQ